MNWPPPYQLRISQRAQSARLYIKPNVGLEVVLPVGFQVAQVPGMLVQHRAWIEAQLAKLQLIGSPPELPQQLALTAIQQVWQVEYQPSAQPLRLQEYGLNRLCFAGEPAIDTCRAGLNAWLCRMAKRHLPPQLTQLSAMTGLSYQRVRINMPKTRWGSCSYQGNINLNAKLLFLPPVWVRYVMLHELCHTVHLNHSRAFWSLLKQHEPDALTIRQALRQASRYLPRLLY